jgi:hypothetical protein
MRKILIFAVLLSMTTVAAVFGAGDQEDDYEDGRRPGRRYGYGPRHEERWEGFNGEILSLTGTVKAGDGWRPELETSGGTYELMYPPFLDDGLDVKDGEEITVEGYLVPGPRWEENEEREEQHLHVTKAVIDGKEYVIEHPGPRSGGPGGRRDYGGRGCRRDDSPGWGNGRGDSRGYGRR